MTSRSAYLTGNDPLRWKQDIAHYARVRNLDVYPGIDVVYYMAGQELEFDFVVAPGADPNQIRLSFPGASKPRLDRNGDLVFSHGLRQRRPVAYQETEAGRWEVEARYRLGRHGDVSFVLGRYDADKPLVIDPVLYAGYFGGDRNERANAIAVAKDGSVWVTGSSSSVIDTLPGTTPIQDALKGRRDVFLAKLTRDDSGRLTLAYWTQLGGADNDEATAIAMDGRGFVYLAGYTFSSDFPGAGAVLQQSLGGMADAFVVKINMDLPPEALWYSQHYGGTNIEVATSVAVDSEGAIYLAGYTASQDLQGPSDQRLQCCNRGGYEGFLLKVLPDSSSPLAYATYLGGESTDVIRAITVDAEGNLLLAGYTASNDFPVTADAFQNTLRSGIDLFLVKLDLRRPQLGALIYGTFIGGSGLDIAQSMAIDAQGGIWIGGYTLSTDLPVTANAYRRVSAGLADAFLLRFDLAGNAISYCTYVGGRGDDVLYGIALAPGGRVALAGYTLSDDFPLVGDGSPPTGTSISAEKSFVTLINTTSDADQALVFSTTLGGTFGDAATGVAVDADDDLFVSGFTYSFDFPVTDDSRKLSPGGLTQSFVVNARPARN